MTGDALRQLHRLWTHGFAVGYGQGGQDWSVWRDGEYLGTVPTLAAATQLIPEIPGYDDETYGAPV